ncbi:MAG: MazG family protein [Candidatus Neptunochlamydia sp.]|nr:MazG family protein [Candidatus Neptunochlamydia sp.]
MKEFDRLIEITDALHGPNGCPWDKKQTFRSLRPHILEEVHELLDSIDEEDFKGMIEELGDILFQILFFAKLGEKREKFSLKEIITIVSEKLVRRHPHVFGDLKVETPEEVIYHWERVKKEEKKERKSALEGIPKTLTGLARAQKVISKLRREKIALPEKESSAEISFGGQLLNLVIQAQGEDIDAESALRAALKRYEKLLA